MFGVQRILNRSFASRGVSNITLKPPATLRVFTGSSPMYKTSDLTEAVVNGNTSGLTTLLTNQSVIDQINTLDERGSAPLHYAAFFGKLDVISILLENGAEVDIVDHCGATPLHRAVVKDNSDVVEVLLKSGASVLTKCRKSGQTVLHAASTHNALNCASVILDATTSCINEPDARGCTALHISSYYAHEKFINLLIAHGCDLDARDVCDRTALHWAALGDSVDVMKILEDVGADLKAVDARGRNILHFGAQVGSCAVIEFALLHSDLSVDCEDHRGFAPVHYAMQNSQMRALKMLTSNGASCAKKSFDGTTPFHIAAFYAEHGQMLEMMLQKESVAKAALELQMNDGSTLLHKACEWGRMGRVELLIKLGVDVNAETADGVTPLHCAALGGHYICVKLLLQAGAKIEKRKRGGYTALHMAAANGFLETVRVLADFGADPNGLDNEMRTALHIMAASTVQHMDISVEKLLQTGKCCLDVRDKKGMMPIHYAAKSGQGKIVELLLGAGASALSEDGEGRNPLHWASLHPHNSIAILALCRADEACITKADKRGFYPIHYASHFGNQNLSAYLLDKMSPLEIPTSGKPFHLTPLHIAAALDRQFVLKALLCELKKKAEAVDPAFKDKTISHLAESTGFETDYKRRLPLHYAMYYGNFDCVRILLGTTGTPKRALLWEDINHVTPLHMAASKGHARILNWIANKYDIILTKTDERKRTCVHMAAFATPAVESGELNPLLSKFCLDSVDELGRGLLHRACASHNVELVRQLLQLGARANITDVNGVTPLHVACRVGASDVVKLLFESNCSPDRADCGGMLPADWAAASGQTELMCELLASRADTSTSSGDSALGTCEEDRFTPENGEKAANNQNDSTTSASAQEEAACSGSVNNDNPVRRRSMSTKKRRTRKPSLAESIKDKVFHSEDLVSEHGVLQAAYHGHIDCLRKILEVLPNLLNSVDDCKRSALQLAACQGNISCVEHLLELGANVDHVDIDGQSALMLSTRCKETTACTEMLLEHGADLSLRDSNENTVLHLCAIHENTAAGIVIVSALAKMEHDAKVQITEAKNSDGQTAVHIICKNGMMDLLLDLVPHAVDSCHERDNNGRIPMTCVVENPHVAECIEFLLNCMLNATDAAKGSMRSSLASTLSKRRSQQSTLDDTF